MLERLRGNVVLAGLLLLGLSVRLIGVNHGLPYLYTDEPTFAVPATQMLQTGDLNPHWFGHPGSVLMYTLAVFFALITAGLFVLWTLTGRVHGLADFKGQFTPDLYRSALRPFYYLSGRLMTVALAVVTIYLVYRIGKRLFGRNAGLLAALILALSPMHVGYSRFVRDDVPGALLIVASVYFLLLFCDKKSKKWFFMSALFAGLAVAAKYTYGLLILPLSAAVFFETRRDRTKLLFQGALLAFLGFFIAAPFVLLDFKHAFVDILGEVPPTHLGADRLPGLGTHWWFLKDVLRRGIGGIYFHAFAALGLFFSVRNRSPREVLLLIFPVAYITAMGFGNIRMSAWMLPVLPFEAVWFGAGLTHLKLVTNRPKIFAALLAVTAVFAGRLAWTDGLEVARITRPDTRATAKAWAERNLPDGAFIAYEDYAPRFDTRNIKRFRLMDQGWNQIVSQPLSYYEEAGVDYIVVTDSIKGRYYKERDKYPRQIKRYEELKQKAKLVYVIREQENPGPVIEIYKLER